MGCKIIIEDTNVPISIPIKPMLIANIIEITKLRMHSKAIGIIKLLKLPLFFKK